MWDKPNILDYGFQKLTSKSKITDEFQPKTDRKVTSYMSSIYCVIFSYSIEYSDEIPEDVIELNTETGNLTFREYEPVENGIMYDKYMFIIIKIV